MSTRVCPWWLTYTFDNPLRRLLHDPRAILAPYVREGMRVADIGCGMGYFTPTLAALVGDSGRVQAVDLQVRQLATAKARCEKSRVAARVVFTEAAPDSLELEPPLDFVLAFWMVHEVPQAKRFLGEISASLKAGGRLFVAEPKLHVSGNHFEATLALATQVGFAVERVGGVNLSRAVVLTRS